MTVAIGKCSFTLIATYIQPNALFYSWHLERIIQETPPPHLLYVDFSEHHLLRAGNNPHGRSSLLSVYILYLHVTITSTLSQCTSSTVAEIPSVHVGFLYIVNELPKPCLMFVHTLAALLALSNSL